jgi:hypothetical protein
MRIDKYHCTICNSQNECGRNRPCPKCGESYLASIGMEPPRNSPGDFEDEAGHEADLEDIETVNRQ